MHTQQPWVNRSDKPCLVTYKPISQIDRQKIIGRWWFQYIVHDVRHMAWLIYLFRSIQGKRRVRHCGAPHVGQQLGNLLRYRACRCETDRRRLSLRGPRGQPIVQLLRGNIVRLALQEGKEVKFTGQRGIVRLGECAMSMRRAAPAPFGGRMEGT